MYAMPMGTYTNEILCIIEKGKHGYCGRTLLTSEYSSYRIVWNKWIHGVFGQSALTSITVSVEQG